MQVVAPPVAVITHAFFESGSQSCVTVPSCVPLPLVVFSVKDTAPVMPFACASVRFLSGARSFSLTMHARGRGARRTHQRQRKLLRHATGALQRPLARKSPVGSIRAASHRCGKRGAACQVARLACRSGLPGGAESQSGCALHRDSAVCASGSVRASLPVWHLSDLNRVRVAASLLTPPSRAGDRSRMMAS